MRRWKSLYLLTEWDDKMGEYLVRIQSTKYAKSLFWSSLIPQGGRETNTGTMNNCSLYSQAVLNVRETDGPLSVSLYRNKAIGSLIPQQLLRQTTAKAQTKAKSANSKSTFMFHKCLIKTRIQML